MLFYFLINLVLFQSKHTFVTLVTDIFTAGDISPPELITDLSCRPKYTFVYDKQQHSA